MRELRDSYHRANACVACHQITEPALVAVGRHPALTFELDGQVNSQPPHWRETAGHDGAQAWFVGQAVALREMSAALRDGRIDASRETPRWQALLWLVQRTGLDFDSPELAGLPLTAQPPTLTAAAELADQVAQRAAKTWAPAQTKAALARLAATHAEFSAANARRSCKPAAPSASCWRSIACSLRNLRPGAPPPHPRASTNFFAWCNRSRTSSPLNSPAPSPPLRRRSEDKTGNGAKVSAEGRRPRI